MSRQLSLFDGPRRVAPRDPRVASDEKPRLGGQNARILERLRKGPATNAELAAISLKYTARISDLRHAGYDVRVIHHDRTTGVAVYQLMHR